MAKQLTALREASEEEIVSRIYLIRGQKVMLDKDLAEMYGVETSRLNEAVKRNQNRFPNNFMFQLTKQEFQSLISQIAISKTEGRGGVRKPPPMSLQNTVYWPRPSYSALTGRFKLSEWPKVFSQVCACQLKFKIMKALPTESFRA